MGWDEMASEYESERDPAYPTLTPPDAAYPCQTLAPIAFPLDGIATPAIWSRLQAPLGRALDELWSCLGLLRRAKPGRWASIYAGRIALNAHGWERLRTLLCDEPADPTLIAPPELSFGALAEHLEAFRVRYRRRSLPQRLKRAEVRAHEVLTAAAQVDPRELDAFELARGPLDEPSWAEILLPWLAGRLTGSELDAAARPVSLAIELEQRSGAELGRRLVRRAVLRAPGDVAYLTVEERIRAVHEGSSLFAEQATARAERVARFVKLELPERFWGRPRLEDLAGPLR